MTDKPQTQLDQALDRIDILEDRLAKQEKSILMMAELLDTHQKAQQYHNKALKGLAEVTKFTTEGVTILMKERKR